MPHANGSSIPHPHRHLVREQLQGVTDRLVTEYGGLLPAGSIVRCVARSTRTVARGPVAPISVAAEVERLARSRLEGRLSTGSWPVAPSAPGPGTGSWVPD